jgi:hypothetical protein
MVTHRFTLYAYRECGIAAPIAADTVEAVRHRHRTAVENPL